jgi:hypothetical protein
MLRTSDLLIGDTGVSGWIDLDPDGSAIEVVGTVGDDSYIRILKSQWGVSPAVTLSSAPGEPLINRGRLDLESQNQYLTVGGAVVNRGTMNIGPGRIDLTMDSLANHGILSITDSIRYIQSGGVLRNAGTITNTGSLVMRGSAFSSMPNGTMTGPLVLENGGRLDGRGSVGDVISIGGNVLPGGASPGTLSMASLVLDNASTVHIDVAGTGPAQADRIAVGGAVSFGGKLAVRNIAPFTPGLCGQAIAIMTIPTTALQTGAFTQFVGFHPAARQAWRLHNAADALTLAGYDPTTVMGFAPTSLALTEGGKDGAADLCLGGAAAPTGDVRVVPAAARGQLYFSPRTVVFGLPDWQLPKRLAVGARDDAIGEGPHADSVKFTVASTDPAYHAAVVGRLPVRILDNDPGTDLAVSIVSGSQSVNVNQTGEVRFRISNVGPAASTGASFTLAPFSAVAYVSNTPQVSCALTTGPLACSVGALAAGAQVEFTVVFRGLVAGVHTNTAVIAGNEYDPVAANNSVDWVLTIN